MQAKPFPPIRLAGPLVLALLLVGCTEVVPGLRGRIEGTVTFGGAPLHADAVATTPLHAAAVVSDAAPFVPGELIVGLRDGVAALARADDLAPLLDAVAPFGAARVGSMPAAR